jgi:hypothetical protein
MQTIKDHDAPAVNGFIALIILAVAIVMIVMFFFDMPADIRGYAYGYTPPILPVIVCAVFVMLVWSGLTIVSPNEAKVLTFFGSYVGTVKDNGLILSWPVEIGAVVVWRVADAAQAVFNIDDYKAFVWNQSDIAIRTIAATYPYDSDERHSLRGNIEEVAAKLQTTLQEKLSVAGIVIEETKLSHLAYASEVAAAMLKRQQAVAVLQARRYMVENTLAIIDEVLAHFDKDGRAAISPDKKADLINSLLVTMTSDKESSPVINLGK